MNTFGDFLYELRKEKDLTQAALAEALGVTNKAVSKWETGEAMPETGLLVPLAQILGVTVDELLRGERNAETDETPREPEENLSEAMKQHLFTRGKDDAKTLREAICGAVCAAVVVAGITVYLCLGILWNMWNPHWVLIPVSALVCGIAGIIFDLTDPVKRNAKLAKKENPYTGAACGIIVLSCISAYLLVGAFTGLWHPYWLIVVCGALSCFAVGAAGEIWVRGRKKNK